MASPWVISPKRPSCTMPSTIISVSPHAFPFSRGQNATQVVEIGRLSVGDFAEETILHHAQHHHLGIAIAAVFQNDAMLARRFRGIDNIPALLQSRARRD